MIKQQLESMRASIADTPYDIQHRARMDDTTLVHRDGRHGLFIRSDGTTDVMSTTSYIGVGTNGISAQAPAIYLQTRGMAIRQRRWPSKSPKMACSCTADEYPPGY